MKILLTNDDGVYAKGLNILADSLHDRAKLTIVAPDRDCSGVSNSLTLTAPLRVRYIEDDILSVEGTPVDCVHMALTGLFRELPEIVISGINSCSNLGDDVLYSGTVAAAMEGRNLGFPAIAISLVGEKHLHFETASQIILNLLGRLTIAPLSPQTILNINVPDVPFSDLKGMAVTRLGSRHRAEPLVPAFDPRGDRVYWVGAAGKEQDAGPGTDFYAITNNMVSITPIHVDLTHYHVMDQLTDWVDQVDWNKPQL